MNSITVNTEVEVELEEIFSQIDEEVLVDELKNRGYTVFSDTPNINDHAFVNETAERLLAIINLFKSHDTQEDGINLVKTILTRALSFM